MDEVVVAECGARAPKHAEFHFAKRLQREAEELLVYVKSPKNPGRRPDSQSRRERKRAEISGSAKQPAKTEETRSRADVPAKTSTGWTPPGDVKYAVEDAERSSRDSRN